MEWCCGSFLLQTDCLPENNQSQLKRDVGRSISDSKISLSLQILDWFTDNWTEIHQMVLLYMQVNNTNYSHSATRLIIFWDNFSIKWTQPHLHRIESWKKQLWMELYNTDPTGSNIWMMENSTVCVEARLWWFCWKKLSCFQCPPDPLQPKQQPGEP